MKCKYILKFTLIASELIKIDEISNKSHNNASDALVKIS